MRLVYIATDPITVYRLMDGQLEYMRERGFEVSVIAGPGPLLERAAVREGVSAVAVPMTRELSPLLDVVALARLVRELKRMRPHIVNAGTPKAGLLGVLAARLAGVPVVVYLLRGLRFEGATGARRLLLAATEHAQMDDSGDGRATEVQIDYLPEALGGRLRPGADPPRPKGDGKLARTILLEWPPSPPRPLAGEE